MRSARHPCFTEKEAEAHAIELLAKGDTANKGQRQLSRLRPI
jgi:hypothetical protein